MSDTLLIRLSYKTYTLDRRAGRLVNILNPRDQIRLQDFTDHLIRLSKAAPQDIKDQCIAAAQAVDRALGRPRGSTTKPLLTAINDEAKQLNTPQRDTHTQSRSMKR